MKKDEIFEQVPWLTDSVFRRHVTRGIVRTISKGRGKGKGLGSENAEYAENTVEILRMVHQLGETVRHEDLVYVLLWEGYEIDLEKLHGRLFIDFDRLIKSLEQAGSILDDEDSLKDIAHSHLPTMRPGKPSNAEVALRTVLENKEVESIRTHFDVAKRIADRLPVGEQILTIAKSEKAKEEEGFVELIESWISIEKWRSLIREATVDDLQEVYRSILLLREYTFIFKQHNPEVYEQHSILLELLKRPRFLKVYTFFLLVPCLREFVLSFNEPDKKDSWKELCNDPDLLLQLKGGEAP